MTRHMVAAALLLASTVLSVPMGGLAQESGVVSAMYQGTCDGLGEVVAPLDDAVLPAGDQRGSAAAMPAANSFTAVPLTRDALTTSDYAIVVSFPVGEEHLACGEIGGTLTDAGALIVGLRPTGEMDVNGIAFLAPAADPAQTGISLFLSGDDLSSLFAATFYPPTVAAGDAAAFASALAARADAPSLGGPVAGTFHQRPGMLAATPIGTNVADFSATVTFVNPRKQTETPWDYGFAFHQNLEPYTVQEILVDSSGVWSYRDFPNGTYGAGPLTNFDPAPGAMNTLDLIVQGDTALLGVNGEFATRLTLPPATSSAVMAATDFNAGNIVDGREIIFSGFQVWEAPGAAARFAEPQAALALNDATRFAEAIADRHVTTRLAGPFAGEIPERGASSTLRPARVSTEDFSVTTTFTNPTAQTETPWDVGFAFHAAPDAAQAIYIDSAGFWYHQGTQVGFVPKFDTSPGATNTLDLVVEGTTAMLGVNGAFVARVDLPEPIASDVYMGVGFFEGHKVEGRLIPYRGFEVWE